jgi:hypothetical protein
VKCDNDFRNGSGRATRGGGGNSVSSMASSNKPGGAVEHNHAANSCTWAMLVTEAPMGWTASAMTSALTPINMCT